MHNFEKGVPFDPGYSDYAIYFPDNVQPYIDEMAHTKAPHQKKFRLSMFEPVLHKLINNCAGFYLGCVLWGSYIHCKFADNPKEILDNPMKKLSKEELDARNYTEEIDFILEFIKQTDRDFKYFLKKPFNVDDSIIEIFNSYKEFTSINNKFAQLNLTSEIKLPEAVKHIAQFDNEKLDALYNSIIDVIESEKLEKMLEIGFYRN